MLDDAKRLAKAWLIPEIIQTLKSAILAMEQSRMEAGRVDTENGHTTKARARFYPANISVCCVTQEALDAARTLLAKLEKE